MSDDTKDKDDEAIVADGRILRPGGEDSALAVLRVGAESDDRIVAASSRLAMELMPRVMAWLHDEVGKRDGFSAEVMLSAISSAFISSLLTASTTAALGDEAKAKDWLQFFSPNLMANLQIAINGLQGSGSTEPPKPDKGRLH
jgi:hypothetical protein